jgi:2-oxo-4-hydroxy-4-carboxy-5-ureidoimidazoline decarboxylase
MGQSSKPPHICLNELSPDAAREALTRCCGSRRWVAAMIARRPFESTGRLLEAARETWLGLDHADHIEAFQNQPRMGENLSELARRSPSSARMAAREQAKLAQSTPETLRAFREDDQRYLERFGYPFVASPTGRSARDLLDALRERLGHDPAPELEIAVEEQSQLIALRMAQLA